MRSKKGDGTFWIIGEIAIVVVILVIVFLILNKNFGWFNIGINSCEAKGGQCMSSCGEREPIPAGDGQCKTEHKDTDMVCCKKPEAEPGTEGEDARGYGANVNQLSVLVDNQKTSVAWGETRELEIKDTPYKIAAVLDYGKIMSLGKYQSAETTPVCSFFLEDTSTNKEYVLRRESSANPDPDPSFGLRDPAETFNTVNSFVVGCTATNPLLPRFFLPDDFQANRVYKLRVVVYDSEVSKRFPGSFADNSGGYSDEIDKLISDESHWLVEFTSYFKVKPIIEIRDIGGTWASSDDITVNVVNPNYKLSSVEVAIVPGEFPEIKGDATASLFQKLTDACSNKLPGVNANYISMLRRIKSTKVGTPGFNLGLFALGREAYQTALYDASEPEPIKIENNVKATVHIDAATISSPSVAGTSGTFVIWDMKVERVLTETNPLKEQYLCVRARVASSDGRTVKTITTVNQQPLRIDVAPPLIDNTDAYISIEYPNPESFQQTVTQLIAENRISPTQRLTPYYFNRYPRVVFNKCIDRSGCKEYDWYFAPTNIQINVNSGGDLGTSLTALFMSTIVNQLYQSLVTTKPLETLCPLPNNVQYRFNSASEIRFSRLQQGQGVYCLKIVDAAGNYWMTWKAVYNPYDVFDEATGVLLGTGVTN